MDDLKLFEALGDAQDCFILSAAHLLGYTEERLMTQKKTRIAKLSKTLLIAAIIACFMAATALAVGISVHQRRQQEIRQQLKIEQNGISSYVEYEEGTGGASLISSINGGEFITVYVNLSPMSEAEVRTLYGGDELISELMYYVGDTGHGGSAMPRLTAESLAGGPKIKVYDEHSGESIEMLDPEWVYERVLENCYDSQTQTLTVSAQLYCSWLEELGVDMEKPIELGFFFNELQPMEEYTEVTVLRDFGTVSLEPGGVQERFLSFEGLYLTEKCELASVRLSPVSVTLGLRHEESELIFNLPDKNEDEAAFRAAFERQLWWLDFYDELLGSARLCFADGTELPLSSAESVPYENGIVYLYSSPGSTLDIQGVEGIILLGDYIEFE